MILPIDHLNPLVLPRDSVYLDLHIDRHSQGGIHVMTKKMSATIMLLIVLPVVLCVISGTTSEIRAAEGQDNPESQTHQPQGDDANLPKGVIGVSLRVGAERIGDPASLYVAHVHPESPAQQAGLKHRDEVMTMNGAAVSGKTYEQVIQMVRGEAGTVVKLGMKGDGGVREIAITRIAGEKLYKSEMGSHGGSAR
jgi:S1-C subfamily serine protease